MNAPYTARGWFPRGETPVVKTSFTREKFHCFGVVNGRREHYSFFNKINSRNTLVFIKRLQARYPRLLLFLDNAPWHRTKKIALWCKTHYVRLSFFPSYSPELNPCEPAWKNLKFATANSCFKTKNEFIQAVRQATRVKNLTKMFQYFNY